MNTTTLAALIEQLEDIATSEEVINAVNKLGIQKDGNGAYATISDQDADMILQFATISSDQNIPFTQVVDGFIKREAEKVKVKKGSNTSDDYNRKVLGVTESEAVAGSFKQKIIQDQKNIARPLTQQRYDAIMDYSDYLLTRYLVDGIPEELQSEENQKIRPGTDFLQGTVLNLINWNHTPEQLLLSEAPKETQTKRLSGQ
jgi:hypothetical protein